VRKSSWIAVALALGLCGLALALAGLRGDEEAEEAGRALVRESPGPSRTSDLLASSAEGDPERREALTVTEEVELAPSSDAEPRRALVQVRGQVRRSGAPVEGFDLSFRATGSELDEESEEDWSLTDQDGGYEVELRRGKRYVVVDDEDESYVTEVVAPETESELVLDIYLPRER